MVTTMTSTSTSNSSTLLKTDCLGRVRTPPDKREAYLDTFEQSGLSGVTFCKLHGLRYTTFASWRQKRRRGSTQPAAQAVGEVSTDLKQAVPFFEEVVLPPPVRTDVTLQVELPGGASFVITEADQLPLATALLRYLEESTC